MRTLVIDNYDSFTYNLAHLLAEVNQDEPIVLRNDAIDLSAIAALDLDNIVISPGPGRPERAADFGIALLVIAATELPVLGVCLGHQGIAFAHGATIVAAPQPMHGRISRIHHAEDSLFAGIPPAFDAVRYHSLIVASPLPAPLIATAWSEDGLVMALRHREKPLFGVQFHPESVLTEHGRRIVENFRDLTRREGRRTSFALRTPEHPRIPPPVYDSRPFPGGRRAIWRELPEAIDGEAAFCALYAESPAAFWLDGEQAENGIGRWSFLGDAEGPGAALLSYDAAQQSLSVATASGVRHQELSGAEGGIFDYLNTRPVATPANPPPCPFIGGLIGWFGYELRGECGAPGARRSSAPDAYFIQPERYIAIDHHSGRSYLIVLADNAAGAEWLDATERRLASLGPAPAIRETGRTAPITFTMARDRETYLGDIERALEWIRQGETYQLCLTNEISCTIALDPLDLYRVMRRTNPAPHAAFLRWPEGAVISASPERFLAVEREGRVEARPIKGTIGRSSDPAIDASQARALRSSEKNRAENLMIVDLLRNDLSRCCRPGSVAVPSLMAIESYATLHQLVSTVTGRLRPGSSAIDLLRAAFPGGSMTGAPKRRTLDLIDILEQTPRGIYSGGLGWLGDDGAMDLSIVIRTIVAIGDRLSIGCGGAIVAQSDPAEEFEEMLLKARAPIAAIVTTATGGFASDRFVLAGAAPTIPPS